MFSRTGTCICILILTSSVLVVLSCSIHTVYHLYGFQAAGLSLYVNNRFSHDMAQVIGQSEYYVYRLATT